MRRRNGLFIALVLTLSIFPLLLPSSGQGERFSGADQQAEGLIQRIRPDYTPWFRPFWEPPSGDVESLLFAVQAALGAGLLGYWLGFARGRSRDRGEEGPRVSD